MAEPTSPSRWTRDEPPVTDGMRAQGPRIAEAIRDIGQIGKDPAGGWTRLAFTREERAAHDQVANWLDQLGLKVDQDPIGNTFVRREGSRSEAAPIVVGSHLDTVPQGGRFDGVAGVVAMVETMRILEDHSLETSHPIVGVIFSAEEGARFGEPCIGSKAVAGALDETDLNRLKDAAGITAADAMSSVGLDPQRVIDVPWGKADAAAFLELHIEQGPILESSNAAIGLVDVVSGSTRMRITVTGEAGHSGANAMRDRADAIAAAAEMILAVESLARDPFHRGLRGTVGWIDVHPNSATTIAGRVTMMVDLRDVDSGRQRDATQDILRRIQAISDLRGVHTRAEIVADTSPAVLSMWLRELLREECVRLKTGFRVLTSGAGHDAQIMARLFPSALLFVPSGGGVSHHPDEWTSPEAIAKGVDLIVAGLLKLSDMLLPINDT